MPIIHNPTNKLKSKYKPTLTSFNKIGVTSFVLSMVLMGSSGGIASASPVETYVPQATSVIEMQSQSIKVSAKAAPIIITRDGFTATSPEELATTKAAEDAAIAKKAADDAAAIINSRMASSSSSPLPNGIVPGQVIPASGIIAAAQQWVGVVPYGAGNHPSDTFSCDGYTQYVFAQNGIHLPRGAGAQAALGTEISQADAQAGDLVYWPGAHIGIYDGNGGMYDSPMEGRYVQHRVGSLWGNPVFIRL